MFKINFTMDVDIGDAVLTLQKEPNVLEHLNLHGDTWGLGKDSFLSMIYERLVLMKDLLADDGPFLFIAIIDYLNF